MIRKISKRLREKEFTAIFKKIPRLVVDAVIKTPAGILFAKRDIEPRKGMWHIPGGTVRLNESLKEAIVRIIYEETGLTIKVGKILGSIEYIYARDKIHNHSVSVVFLASPIKGALRGSLQGREVRYFSSMPKNIILEQKIFLKEHGLM